MLEYRQPAGTRSEAVIRFTERADGDFAIHGRGDALDRRRAEIASGSWTWLRQVHGADVVDVDEPGGHAGVDADAAVTSVAGAPLAIHTADCAPLALIGDGAVAAVHAGWKGLLGGVVERTVVALTRHGDGRVRAVLGPCIRPESYEFGRGDLETMAERFGPGVTSHTTSGRPALDLPAAVRSALEQAGAELVLDVDLCTSSPRFYSHRVRGDAGRQAMVVWLERA